MRRAAIGVTALLVVVACRAMSPPPDPRVITDQSLTALAELAGASTKGFDATIAALRAVQAAAERAGAKRAKIAAASLLGEQLAGARVVGEADGDRGADGAFLSWPPRHRPLSCRRPAPPSSRSVSRRMLP